MQKRNHNLFGISAGLLAVIFLQTNCSDISDCKYTANRSIKVNFTQLTARNTLVDTTVSNLSVTTASSTLLYDSVSARQLQLPLSQLSDTSAFYLYFDSLAVDTLWVFVQRKIEMISPECGFNTRFLIDSAKSSHKNIVKTLLVERTVGDATNTDRNINIMVKKRP